MERSEESKFAFWLIYTMVMWFTVLFMVAP